MDIIFYPILSLMTTIISLYTWVLIATVILSWLVSFNIVNTSNRTVTVVGEVLYRLTEPLLGPIRRFLPNLGGLDLSPLVAMLLLQFLSNMLVRLAINLVGNP